MKRQCGRLHADEVLEIDLAELNAQEIRPVGTKSSARPRRKTREPLSPPETDADSSSQIDSESKQPNQRSASSTSTIGEIKFRLHLDDPTRSGSIDWQKTAARFEELNIFTVRDFLESDPIMTSISLNTRHISTDVLRQWQTQAELACRIPMIYGHDAQIMTGCGFESPEEVAEADPEMILSLVDEFTKTDEAKFILRSSKAPDLDEVTNWIQWSQQSRSLNAA